MTPLAIDCETALIRPAQMAPPMACVTYAASVERPCILHVSEAHDWVEGWLDDRTLCLISHNTAYDTAVICAQYPDLIPKVFAAYRDERITCTMLRQKLLDIAGGVYRGRVGEKGRWIVHKYELADLVKRYLGRELIKDGWRLSYGKFIDVPISGWVERAKEVQAASRVRRAELPPMAALSDYWKQLEREGWAAFEIKALKQEIKDLDAIIADVPEGVIRYPLDDAASQLGVYLAQEKHAAYLDDQYRQAYAYFVLNLSSVWGLRTDAEDVAGLKGELTEAYEEIKETLQELGFVRVNGTRDVKLVKAAMIDACREYSLPIRRTDGHVKCDLGDACTEHVSLDSDACDAVVEAAGGDETPFIHYAEFVTLGKMISNDCKMLESGNVYPIHTRYDLAETGRTTSSKPNIQNLNTGRVKNKKSFAQRNRPRVRSAFVPRAGYVYAQADYPQLELYTLAQCCMKWVGFSKLAEALNAGLDPHLAMAAKIVGCSYEHAAANKKRDDIDKARQIGKVFNFGKPGGLGNKKLILWARKTYGVVMTPEQCEAYTVQWYETFPEMLHYFARVAAMFPEDVQRASVETLFTERRRGGATYCAACNNGFQALGADCAKRGMVLVAEAEYVDRSSPLFGSRTCGFFHDEIIVETPDRPEAHEAAFELARLMVKGANEFLPDVPIPLSKMEPTLMRRLSKAATQIFKEGRLVPWEP